MARDVLKYDAQFGIGVETTPGTAVTRTIFPALTDLFGFKWDQKDQENNGLDQTTGQRVAHKGKGQGTDGYTARVIPTTIKAELDALIGRTDGQQNYLTLEAYDSVDAYAAAGCRCSELEMTFNDEMLTYSPRFIGMNKPANGSKTAGTISTLAAYGPDELAFSIGGVTTYEVYGFRLGLNFAIEPKWAGLAKTTADGGPTILRQGRPVVTLTADIGLGASTLMDAYLAKTELAFIMTATRSTNILTVTLPRIRIQSAEPKGDGDNMNISIEAKAYHDATEGTAKMLEIETEAGSILTL